MAESGDDTERTEEPTPKRLEEAIERGDVAKSQEVNTWFVLSAGALMLLMFGTSTAESLATSFRGILSNAYAIPADGGGLTRFVIQVAGETVRAVGLPLMLMALAGVASNLVQHRPLWTTEPITPEALEDLADQRAEAPVRQGGAGPVPQGAGQDRDRRRRALCHPVAAARAAGAGGGLRRRDAARTGPGAVAEAVRRRHRGDDGRRGARLSLSVDELAAAAAHEPARDPRGVQAERRRSPRQGANQVDPPEPHEEADDRPGAQGLGGDHQPDPLSRWRCSTRRA